MAKIIFTLLLLFSLRVSAQPPPPQPVDEARIVTIANETMTFYRTKAKEADSRASELSTQISFWKVLTKSFQYAGGGGAIVFGLDEKGKNAALSGAVAALATIVDQLAGIDDKAAEKSSCLAIENLDVVVFGTTEYWKASAKNPAFQATFPADLLKFYK